MARRAGGYSRYRGWPRSIKISFYRLLVCGVRIEFWAIHNLHVGLTSLDTQTLLQIAHDIPQNLLDSHNTTLLHCYFLTFR